MNIVGQQVKRVDAYGKVTGEAKYTADLEPRDILHGKVVHSTIANGLVKSIDLTEAYKVPGVVNHQIRHKRQQEALGQLQHLHPIPADAGHRIVVNLSLIHI